MISSRKKSNNFFASILLVGLAFLSFGFYFSFFLFGKIKLVWLSVLGKLETSCGCPNHFVFSNHPYLFSFLILSFFLLLFFVIAFTYRIYKLHKNTKNFIKKSLSQKKETLSPSLETVLNEIKLNNKVLELKESPISVFTFGFLDPKICISTSFVNSLKKDELKAVLLHEQAHLLAHDPLKFFIVKLLSKIFFFVPFFSIMINKFYLYSEISADEWAIYKMRSKVFLARAVYKTLGWRDKIVLKQNLIVPLFYDLTEERINKIIDNKHSFALKLLSKKFIMFLFVFFFSFSAYSILILKSDAVIALHEENPCYAGDNESQTCSHESQATSCSMNTTTNK